MNLVIFDIDAVTDVETLISALTPNTEYLKLRYHEYNYESLKAKLAGKTYHNVAIAQRNEERPDYGFVESNIMPRVKDVQQIDPELKSWSEYIDFVAWLRDNCGTHTIDLLACNLWASEDWKYIINTLKSRLNISIRASLDITGAGGNWVLESDNVETIGLYFTEDVKQYRYHLYQTEFYYFDQNNVLLLDGSGGTLFKTKYAGHINRNYNPTMLVSGTTNGYITLPSDISNVVQVIACQRNLGNDWINNAHAALCSDGTVVTWGERYTFMFDRSSVFDISVNNVKRLYTSWSCVLALRNDNSVVAWGNGSYNITTAHSIYTESTHIKAMPASVTNVKEIFINEQAYCALKNDGTVEAWGFRYGGGDCSSCQTLLTGVKKIAISTGWGGYFIALRNDGNVIAWKGDPGAGWPSGFSTTIGGTWSGKVLDIVGSAGAFFGILNDGTIRYCGPSFFADARGYNMSFATLPMYTLPAGVTVRIAEPWSGGGSPKYYLSNNTILFNRQGGNIIADSDQVLTNLYGGNYPYYQLNRNGSVTVSATHINYGPLNHATYGLPLGTDVSSNVVQIYNTEAGAAARKADGTFVTWGSGANGRPLRFDSSANGIRDVVFVIDTRFGYKVLRSNNRLYTIANPTNTVNNQEFSTTPFSDLSNVLIPTNKNVWIFDNLTYEGSKELTAVELEPFESISPSSFMRLQNTTVVYKSNNCFRVANRGMKYGLYSGTTLLSTFNPLHTTMTYTFENVKVPQLGAVTLSIGLLSVNFQNTQFTFQVNTTENPFLSPPDAPSINSITVSLANSTGSVNFSLPTWDGGAPITSIKYSLDGGLSFTTASSIVSPLSLTGLTQGAYEFVLVATNMIGDSYGTTSSIVMCNPPDAPVITSLTGGNRTLSVGFSSSDMPTVNGSLLFPGNQTKKLYIPNHPDLQFGTGDFTIEWWQYQTDTNLYVRAFSMGLYPNASIAYSCNYYDQLPTFFYGPGPTGQKYQFNSINMYNSWRHIAFCRISGVLSMYINGSKYGSSVTNTTNYMGTEKLSIGSEEITTDNNSCFGGYITGFTWIKGAGLYSGNFTPQLSQIKSAPAGATLAISICGSSVFGTLKDTIVNSGVPISDNLPSGYSKGSSSNLDVVGMNSNVFTVSGNANSLLNGQYIASTSSVYNGTFFPYMLFDGSNNTQWYSGQTYSNPSGIGSYHFYVGSVTTAVETIGTVSGEWLQIRYPNPILVTGYTFSSSVSNYYPNSFWLVGSNNGTTWYPLNYKSGQWGGDTNSNTYTINEFDSAGAYRFFRMIFTAVNGGPYVRLRNFTIIGYPAASNSIVGYKYSLNGGAYISKGTRVSPLSISLLNNATTYNVKMRAINAAGDSVDSNVSSNVTLGSFIPEAPTLVSATPGQGSITINFVPGYNGGSAITAIQYSYNENGSYFWSPFTSITPMTSPFTITGLNNGSSYYVALRAVNAIGTSVGSNQIGNLVPKTIPGKPSVSSNTPGNGTLRIYWYTPDNGGSSITIIKYSLDGSPFINVPNQGSGNLYLTGLENGREYAIRFIAVNAIGESLPSDPIIGIPCDIPSAPAITNIVALDGTANVSFTLASTGGRAITEYQYMLNNPFKYEIRGSSFTGSHWIIVPQHADFDLGTDDFTIEWYQYIPWLVSLHSRVFSFGSESNGISFCFKWFDDQNTSHSTFKLQLCINGTWYDFGYVDPYPWQHIALSRVNGELRVFRNGQQLGATLDCSMNIVHSKRLVIGNDDSLSNNPQFFGTITAFTYITGWGKYTETFTPPTYPVLSVPQGKLVLFVMGARNEALGTRGSTAVLSVETGGLPTGYYNPAYITIPNDTTSPISFGGLTNGTEYSVAIRAKNQAGYSEPSNKFSFTPLSLPDAPVFNSVSYGNLSATLDFSANVLSGNSPIIGYKLSTNLGPFISIGFINSPYTVSGLTNGTTYSFRLKAVSALGDSSSSLISPEVIPRRVPDAPIISVVDNILQATVSFTAGASNGGSQILSYIYSHNDGEEVTLLSPEAQTYTLVLGQTQTFSVRVTNDVGSSASTSISLIGKTIPDAPVIDSIQAGNKLARVYFTAGSSNYSDITGYKYKLNDGTYQNATVSADSSILITGLSENITYNIKLVAINAIGTSDESNSMSVTPYTVPVAPVLDSVVADNGSVTFSFTPGSSNSSDITAFKYSLNNAAYVALSDLTTENVVLSDLSNGILYNLKIKATNAAGDSLASNSLNFMPYGIPSAPVITSVTAGNESAEVYFTPGFFNGSNITQYKYALNGGAYDGTQFVAASALSSPIYIEGLTNGTVYSVSILAVNAAGESNASNSSTSFAPFITQSSPNPPIVQNIDVSDKTATITYVDDFNPGSAIIGYKYSLNGGSYLWFTQTSSPLIITGLTNGETYSMIIKAVNNSGASAPSEQYSFTPCDVPEAPLILNTIAGNQTATLYLDEPNDRGSPITGYYCSLNGGSYYAVEMSGNQIVLDSLENGTEYTVQIKCENSLGMSEESNVSESFITNGLPLPPVITDLAVGDETVSVSFSPADGNGKPVMKYSYCLVVDGVDGEYLSTSDVTSPIVINGLTNGVSYSIKMKSVTANGESAAGLESESFIPCGIPIAPVITNVSYANDQLTIHFIEENTNGKPAIDHLYSIDGGMYFTTSQLSSPLIISNLTSGGNSTVRIKTVTDAGTSVASNQSNSFIPYSMPAEPTITSVVSQDKALAVHFVDGSFNGTTLIGYKYKLNDDESFYWCNSVVSPILITGLTNGTPYTVSLKTVTNFGESDVAVYGSAVIPANLQLPPNIVNIDSSNSSIIVTYTNPQLNGATITGYKYSLNGGDFITLASGVDASNNKLTISGLTNGTSYTVRIKSISSNGDSESSNTSKTVSPFAPPSAPSISRVVTGSQIAQVYFTDGALNGSPAILGYKYSLDGTNYIWSSVTSSPIPLTGLTNNLAYTVRLIAVTSVNQSAPSSASALFVPFTLPEPPTINSVSVSNGTATISYTNGATNGRPFTGFRYSLNGGAPVTIGLENPFTITGLTNGLTYLATMNSINAAGTSVASAPSPAFVPYTVPGAPVISSIVPSDSALTMNISNPNLNGIIENGIPIIGYSYSFNNSTFTFVPTANNATSFTITGLVNGTTYQVYVRSVTNLGLSTVSSPVSAAPRTTPSPVTITSVTAGNKSVTVAFVSGSSNGAAITGYKYSLDNVNYVTATQTSSPITIFNLTNGINYNVYLKATNAVGDSSASLVSSSFMPVTTLTAPLIKSIESKSGGATVNVNNSYFGTVDGSGVSIIGYQYSFDDLSYNLVETTNATSFDISGLDNGSSYRIYVKTVTNIGVSPRSLQSNLFFARSVPDAPTITNVEASDSRVFLHFVDGSNNGSAITGYKYSVDGTTYYTALQNTSPLTLYSLDNATSYQIRLKSVNVMGDSEASVESNAVIPFGVPFAPTITEIVPGNGCAYVYFNEVDNNGSEILKFKYSLGSVLIDVSGLTSPLTIPNLVNKTVYNVVIIANNFAGDSYPSNSMRVVAGAPTDPVITEVVPGPKNIKVFFTIPLDNGSPITQYNVTFDGVKYAKAPGLVSPITLGGLTNGLPYNITFQAVNKNGVSKNSNTIPGVIPYDIPAKITITSVLPRYSSALVTFAPPANNGSAITKYAYAMNADTTYTDISGLVPPLTIPGLPNNTSYTLKLVAYNAAGISPVSAPSKAAMYVYTPPAQIKLGSIVAAKNSLIVSFLPPAPNGAVITGYKYALNADTVYTEVGTTVPFTITGLANNVNYNIRLIATNEAGDSIPSAPAAKPVMFVFLPPAAPVVTTIIGGNQSGFINFTAPKTNGAPISGYKYSVDGGATKIDLSGVISPLMVSGLTNDTTYNLLLYADSEAGLSLPSAVKSFKPIYSAPEKPVIGTIINLNGGASVSFTPGLENGSPITEYLYSLDGGATKISTGSTSLTFSISGLTNDLAYNLLMYAVNAVGTSLASAPKPFMPVYKVPAAPTIGTITTTATTASVAFTPGLANGAPITSYKYSIDAGASWVDVSSLAGPIVISGLTTKVSYNVILRAVNEVGESLSSLPKPFTMK